MVMSKTEVHKIRVYSKKLPSGKRQVKFYLTTKQGNPYYGYILVESGRTLRQVIEIILNKLKDIDRPDVYYHKHLYNIGTKSGHDPAFMIFNQPGNQSNAG